MRGELTPLRVFLAHSIKAGKQKAIKPAPAMQGSIPFLDIPGSMVQH